MPQRGRAEMSAGARLAHQRRDVIPPVTDFGEFRTVLSRSVTGPLS